MPQQKHKEWQGWHRELRVKAQNMLHLVAASPTETVIVKPINLKWQKPNTILMLSLSSEQEALQGGGGSLLKEGFDPVKIARQEGKRQR
jgi:hypothetical protein